MTRPPIPETRLTATGALTSAFEQKWTALLAETDPGSVDQWCSSLAWGLSAAAAFSSADPVATCVADEAALAFVSVRSGQQRLLVPLEPVWLFGAPVVGPSPVAGADLLTRFLAKRIPSESMVLISGYVENSPWWVALVDALNANFRLGSGEDRVRCRASLDGGVDGYLGRRTRAFRRNLRQTQRRCADGELSVVVLDDAPPATVLARVHAIERKSWKGAEDSGIESVDMALLYNSLIPALAESGALRIAVAVDANGTDAGFIFGGVLNGIYRGLQLSFVESARHLGVGNYLQWHEIQRLCGEKYLHTYDMGMEMAYKFGWAESTFETSLLIAQRR